MNMKVAAQQNTECSFVDKAFKANETLNLTISTSRESSLFQSCMGVSNTIIKYNLDNGAAKAKINLNKLFVNIDKAISLSSPTKKMKAEWIRQEGITLPSAEINKIIDTVSINLHGVISKENKAEIFTIVGSLQTLGLDKNAAQSSIKQTVLGNRSVKNAITQLEKKCTTASQKNELRNRIANDITERFYDHQYGEVKLSTVRNRTKNAVLSNLNFKSDISPTKYGIVRDSLLQNNHNKQ